MDFLKVVLMNILKYCSFLGSFVINGFFLFFYLIKIKMVLFILNLLLFYLNYLNI